MKSQDAAVCVVMASLVMLVQTARVEGSTLKPTHLKGLKGVNLTVYVSRDLPDFEGLERDVRAQAKENLARDGGLTDEGPEGVWLSIEVKSYPSKEKLGLDDVIVQVRVQLSEQVKLDRDRSVRIPGGNGAVTWSSEWVSVQSKADLREFVKKEVDSQVGSFAADVRGANE